MIKDFRYIIKRVIIGVLIALLIMIIKGNFLMVVNARTSSDNKYTFFTDPNEPVTNYDNGSYYTNFCVGCDSIDNIDHFRPTFSFKYHDRELSNETNVYNTLIYGSEYVFNNNFVLRKVHQHNNIDYFYSMDFLMFSFNNTGTENRPTTNFPISKNNTYDIVIEFEKDQYSTFYTNNENLDLINNISIGPRSGGDFNDYISYDFVKWITPNDIENGNSNQAYLHIRFTTLSNMYDSYIGYINVGNNEYSFKSFMFNGNNHDSIFTIKSMAIIKNGSVDITSSGNEPVGTIPGMDKTSSEDIETMNSVLKQCDTLDIGCHLDNLLEGIKLIFYRIGQFFQGLINSVIHIFIPTSEQLQVLQNSFLTNSVLLTSKLGFLTYPFEVISDIFNVYINVLTHNTSNYVINIPVLREPIWNYVIYSGGTLDFGYIINYGIIKDLYDIYYMFISVYIILLFLDLCYDSFGAFISGNLHTSSSYTQQDLEMFNYNTGEVYSTTRIAKTSNRSIRS